MGGCLPGTSYILRDSIEERRAAKMTDYELLSLVVGIVSLVIASVTLLLKLFSYLDSRYKRK